MLLVIGVLKSKFAPAPERRQPLNVWFALAGSAGRDAVEPWFTVWAGTAVPPAESNVTVNVVGCVPPVGSHCAAYVTLPVTVAVGIGAHPVNVQPGSPGVAGAAGVGAPSASPVCVTGANVPCEPGMNVTVCVMPTVLRCHWAVYVTLPVTVGANGGLQPVNTQPGLPGVAGAAGVAEPCVKFLCVTARKLPCAPGAKTTVWCVGGNPPNVHCAVYVMSPVTVDCRVGFQPTNSQPSMPGVAGGSGVA